MIDEAAYEAEARRELQAWRERVLRPPNLFDRAAKGVQGRINAVIPERVHAALTAAIGGMVRGILFGSHHTTARPLTAGTLSEREAKVQARIEGYRAAAAAEGGIAGAGGFLLAAADFPILIGIKVKLLFDVAALYGRSGESFDERLHVLTLFQLAFSSAPRRAEVFGTLEDWDARRAERPQTPEAFDWRTFQQEYRDHIDLAKLAQLLPVVGAPVGAFVNWRLLDTLGATAMGGHRLRWFQARDADLPGSPSRLAPGA